MKRIYSICTLAAVGLLMVVSGNATGQLKKSDAVVKVSAKASKPGADGKQVVTVSLKVDPKWHIYANPVGNELLANAKTTVKVAGKAKPESVKVAYPPGKEVKDKAAKITYRVYEKEVAIKATVQRAKGDTGPLEVSVKFMACDDSRCLLPATVKLTVP